MSKVMHDQVFKNKNFDIGQRLTGLVFLPYDKALGSKIYQGLYYDSSGYHGFEPRYVVITIEDFQRDWVEVADEKH